MQKKPIPTCFIATVLTFACFPALTLAQSLPSYLADDSRFSMFGEALSDTDLAQEFAIAGGGTVFAPTDEAFRRLPDALVARLQSSEAADVMEAIVAMHIVPSGAYAADNLPVEMQPLYEDARLVVSFTAGALTLRPSPSDDVGAVDAALAAGTATDARVRVSDIAIDDGVLHGIDRVLLPPMVGEMLAVAESAAAEETTALDSSATDGSFAEQVAAADDGQTTGIVPEPESGTGDEVRPGPEDDVTSARQDAGATVFIYDGENDDGENESTGTGDTEGADIDKIAPETPENIVVLPEQNSPGRSAEPEAAEREVSEPQAAGPATSTASSDDTESGIELSSKIISLAELLGQPVRSASGDSLGEVVDVMIHLDGAQAQTLVYAEPDGFLPLSEIGVGAPPKTKRVAITEISIDPLDGSIIVKDAHGGEQSGDG
ncbi:fasciclin domain-containing protein [Loktanella sp. SALINAS62]|uniref:fasciclin domain-containing protein n=1 Tax=Loktanella sp. SALINAS62 TaxID=2706124 RepID=UPI001B8CBFCE|nr:fasciclin domain-containing protein [Loktanella sp. SALINAS62]MBS1303406.1 hypothetical protein [Loktanella sp. SALINAS62]